MVVKDSYQRLSRDPEFASSKMVKVLEGQQLAVGVPLNITSDEYSFVIHWFERSSRIVQDTSAWQVDTNQPAPTKEELVSLTVKELASIHVHLFGVPKSDLNDDTVLLGTPAGTILSGVADKYAKRLEREGRVHNEDPRAPRSEKRARYKHELSRRRDGPPLELRWPERGPASIRDFFAPAV